MIMNKGLIVLDFHAKWCVPCQTMRPIVKEVMEANPDIKLMSLDVDVNPEIAYKYDVRSLPALVLLKEGVHVHTFTGKYSVKGFKRMITEKLRN